MYLVPHQRILKWAKLPSGTIIVPYCADLPCPHCPRDPVTFQFENWKNHNEWSCAVSVARCAACNNTAQFVLVDAQRETSLSPQSKLYMYPLPSGEITFEEAIVEVSPAFVAIYNQAHKAESEGLDELVGIGYRKALEFLIKDYLIHIQPDKADDIKKKMLGPCISEYVPDQNLKDCASRAAWLGNDETHYVRRWSDYDLSHLKELLEITRYWVVMSLMTEKYKTSMAAGKP